MLHVMPRATSSWVMSERTRKESGSERVTLNRLLFLSAHFPQVFASYLLDKAHWAVEGEGSVPDDQDDARSTNSRTSTALSAAAIHSQATDGRHFPSFLEWLKPRREISDILRKKLE